MKNNDRLAGIIISILICLAIGFLAALVITMRDYSGRIDRLERIANVQCEKSERARFCS